MRHLNIRWRWKWKKNVRITIQLPDFHRQHIGQCEECQYADDGNGGDYHRLLRKRGIGKEVILQCRINCLGRVSSIENNRLPVVNGRWVTRWLRQTGDDVILWVIASVTYPARLLTAARRVMFFGLGIALLVTMRPRGSSRAVGSSVTVCMVVVEMVDNELGSERATIVTGSDATSP